MHPSQGPQRHHLPREVQRDLGDLLAKGHELGSHTYSHVSCRSLAYNEYCADAARGRRTLEDRTGCQAKNFSYPFGHVSLRSKKCLGKQFASARGNRAGFNGPQLDLNLLRANRIYGDMEQSSPLQALISENALRKSWLIFYTHDVRPQPSQYGCTPELFEFVVSEAVRSGSRILNIADTLEEVAGIHVANQEQVVHELR